MTSPGKSQPTYFLIYQMGKVGSTSMFTGLAERMGRANVKHTHDHVLAGQLIRERKASGQPVAVITGFREPLRRCLSAYFGNLAREKNKDWFVGSREEVLAKSVDWLIADYQSKVRLHINETVAPWLRTYEQSTGMPVSAFEKHAWFWKASADGISCYVHKFEELSPFVGALADELQISDLQLKHEMNRSEKWQAPLYDAFRENLRVSRADYASVYGGLDYVEWLYSRDEVERQVAQFLID